MSKINEALNLDKVNIRSVRGKNRLFNQIYADYQEELDGSLTFLGYAVKKSWTDFTAEVNKTANRSIDFCHTYRVRRECIAAGVQGPRVGFTDTDHMDIKEFKYLTSVSEISKEDMEKFGLTEDQKYYIDLNKIGCADHYDCPYVTYGGFQAYTGSIYKQEQEILKQINGMESDFYKGSKNDYTKSVDDAEKADTIRGKTTAFTGEDSDWNSVDLVTEVELLLVYFFDHLDNTKIDDAAKLDLVRFAASTVAKKRLGTDSVLGHRTSPKGVKVAKRDVAGHVAESLINDMVNYVDGRSYVGAASEDQVEYLKDLGSLRNSIKTVNNDSEYQIEGEGEVKPRIRTAKKRGDGYTTFKTMPSKYRSEHSKDIDDSDW